MALIEPLNLQYWFVNVLSGSAFIFIGLMVILIAGLSAKFRMNTMLFGIILSLFAVMVSMIANWLMFLIIVVVGFVIFYTIGKLVKQ